MTKRFRDIAIGQAFMMGDENIYEKLSERKAVDSASHRVVMVWQADVVEPCAPPVVPPAEPLTLSVPASRIPFLGERIDVICETVDGVTAATRAELMRVAPGAYMTRGTWFTARHFRAISAAAQVNLLACADEDSATELIHDAAFPFPSALGSLAEMQAVELAVA